MHVAAVPLGAGVSMTLTSADGSSWRFSDWYRRTERLEMRPTEEDCARRFDSVKEAADYFSARYRAELEKGQ